MKKILVFMGLFILFLVIIVVLSYSVGRSSNLDVNTLAPGQGHAIKLNSIFWLPAPLYTKSHDYIENVFPFPPGTDINETNAKIYQILYWSILSLLLTILTTKLVNKKNISYDK